MLFDLLRFRLTWDKSFLFVLLLAFLANAHFLFGSDEAVMTTIILINSEAMLVDLDERGEVLKQHILVADYFISKQSHEALVRRSIDRMKNLSDIGSIKAHQEPSSHDLADSEDTWRSKRLKSSFTICSSYYLSADFKADQRVLLDVPFDRFWTSDQILLDWQASSITELVRGPTPSSRPKAEHSFRIRHPIVLSRLDTALSSDTG